ncbi:uncharacterized protein G2W53_010227 [Senna tora]|uniref:Uncharacterized protein n=1 Tax=Senna tora TaxID=362788 RepID=A0A834WZR0_9FABA|nr:uncharacterized protein G2W53_010227 [Senna tora]
MPHGSVGRGRLSSSKKKQSRKRIIDGLRRRLPSWISKGSFDKKPVKQGVPHCSSFANPALQEIIGDAWFDSVAKFESDCDDDYQSVLDDDVFVNGIEESNLTTESNHASAIISKNEGLAKEEQAESNLTTESNHASAIISKNEGLAKEEQAGTPGLTGFLSNDPLDIREDNILLRPSFLFLRLYLFLRRQPPSSHTPIRH